MYSVRENIGMRGVFGQTSRELREKWVVERVGGWVVLVGGVSGCDRWKQKGRLSMEEENVGSESK